MHGTNLKYGLIILRYFFIGDLENLCFDSLNSFLIFSIRALEKFDLENFGFIKFFSNFLPFLTYFDELRAPNSSSSDMLL